MTIKVTYNVTDVYMSQSVSPVYINVSYSDGSASGGGVWGSITGTLSNQTDLQNALNAKFDDPTGTTLQYIDGTGALQTFPLTLPVLQEVRNQTGATLDAGTVVYINGATGNKPTVTKAIATGDATSAQTLGMISAAIANNGVGYVVVIGTCGGLDTSAYTEGQQLYLSGTVAGGVTTTKPYAPIHLVYVGIVTRSHPNLGTIEVRVQNGFEMDEIHNVSAQTPSNNDGLFYNTSTSLWESKSITTALGYTPVPTTRNITINGVTYDLSADRTWTIAAGISGSGAAGQVTYWTGASAVSGSNNLTFSPTPSAASGLGVSLNLSPTLTATANNDVLTAIDLQPTFTNGAFTGVTNYAIRATGQVLIRRVGGNATEGFSMQYVADNTLGGTYQSKFVSLAPGVAYRDLVFVSRAMLFQSDGFRNTLLISNNGNVVVNSLTDASTAHKLQVYGDTLLRGSGATSATTALTVQNSSSTNLFTVRNDGLSTFGGKITANGSTTSQSGLDVGTLRFQFFATNNAFIGENTFYNGSAFQRVNTGLASVFYFAGGGFQVGTLPSGTSGTTQTSLNNRMQLANDGKFAISDTIIGGGSITQNESAVLQADSTTRGFLPPRMTTTQKNAITSPAAGLVVYDTTLNKLCVYTTAWETITSV